MLSATKFKQQIWIMSKRLDGNNPEKIESNFKNYKILIKVSLKTCWFLVENDSVSIFKH